MIRKIALCEYYFDAIIITRPIWDLKRTLGEMMKKKAQKECKINPDYKGQDTC